MFAKPLLKTKEQQPLSMPSLIELLKTVLEKGVSVRFQVRGFSMSPFIKDNDIVTLTPLRNQTPGLGDVVAFVLPETNRLLVHRVIGKKNGTYLFKGDNTLQADGSIAATHLLGRVQRVERDGIRIYLGLGLERIFIALLNRKGFLPRLLVPLRKVIRSVIKK